MKNVLNDVWADLRAKRLWPVAVLLLAGLVAVPVLLKKSAEEPPVASVAVERKAPEPKDLKGLSTVQLEENEIEGGSTLNTFDPSNPFSPPKSIVKNSEDDVAGGTTAPTADGETTSDGTVTPTGDDGSGGGDGGSGDDGSGDGGGDDPTTTTTQYTYVIDVTFTANGRTRKIKGMDKLDMLPNEANPLLLFLGVSTNGGNAVFLVDSTLATAGEGKCRPSKADCAFVHLGAGSEQVFTDTDGKSYDLAIDQIRKVKVGADGSASTSKDDETAGAAVGTPTASRRFVPPLLSDLVSVSSTTAGDSDSDSDRR